MTTPTVSLKDIHKAYGDVAAVRGVDLDVADGEFLSLLGPSGCGKTTLLRVIGGFEEPTSGDVLIAGESVVGRPPEKRPVNTVFQAYALFPHMTVAENVAYGLRQKRADAKRLSKAEISDRVRDALALVRMSEYADRRPSKLSGGQQQRVALARAIVNRPTVLLLDEPLSALDRNLREQMQVELKLIQRQVGITFVFVTHDQSEALSMSDRIVVMNAGRIEQLGTPQEVYQQPATAFVAAFTGTQNLEDATWKGDEATSTTATYRPAETGHFSDGQAVRVALRAEAVSVEATDEAEARPNSVLGTLAGSSFLGDVVQHVVITADGREVIARVPVTGNAAPTTGSTVRASWPAEAVRVFASEGVG